MGTGIDSVYGSVAPEHGPAAPTPMPNRALPPKPVTGPLSYPSVVLAPSVKQDGSKVKQDGSQLQAQGELVSASTLQSTSSPGDETKAAVERYKPIYFGGGSISESPSVVWKGLVDAVDKEITATVGGTASPELLHGACYVLIDRADDDPQAKTLIRDAAREVFQRRTGGAHFDPESPHEAAQIAKKNRDEAKGDLGVEKYRLAGAKEKFEAMNNQNSLQEFNDAKRNVEEKERAVQKADARFKKADEVYRVALAKDPASTLPYTEMPPIY
jgi:hypothetical protein